MVVFVGGRFAAEAAPSTERPDVAKLFGNPATRSGFHVIGQVSGRGDTTDIRAFGIFGDEAVELQHGE